jgi:HTH-type transcriptional regulator / antitoxin HipB
MSPYADILQREQMRLRTPADLGALIRDRRIKLGLNQRSLAQKVGVSRQWIVEMEKGKPRAEIGLLLRTIDALGILLSEEKEPLGKRGDGTPTVDIDSIVAAARGKRK